MNIIVKVTFFCEPLITKMIREDRNNNKVNPKSRRGEKKMHEWITHRLFRLAKQASSR